MKNCWYISVILLLLSASCKKSKYISEKRVREKSYIDYCAIVDSLKMLPQYDYNLVKDRTKILVNPVSSFIDTALINNYKRQGYRVVLMQPIPNLRETDSANYVTMYVYEVERIMIQRITDSITHTTGIKPNTSVVWTIYNQKLVNRKCK